MNLFDYSQDDAEDCTMSGSSQDGDKNIKHLPRGAEYDTTSKEFSEHLYNPQSVTTLSDTQATVTVENEQKVESNKLTTIIETFTSIGEFLVFPASETVVTHPRFFCRELVKYIINHEVLSLDEDFSKQDLESFEKSLYSEEGIDPKDRDKLLKRGFYLKVLIEE